MDDHDLSQHRSFLIGLAYRMLGSVAEAEDAVQEALLRASRARDEEIESPRAWLATVVTRICLDQLKSARVKREEYTGPWLPEPVRTDVPGAVVQPKDPEDAESLSLAFLILLETLSPLERAVFLLHEVFDYTHAEVAGILDREEAAVRQLLSRARAHVRDGRPRFRADPERHKALMMRFLWAAGQGDVTAMESMLAADAIARSDGGGKAQAALKPILGANRVARFLAGVAKKAPKDARYELAEVNGLPGVIWTNAEGRPLGALVLELDRTGSHIEEIDVVVNPDKLLHLV